mgnify:CR=1 FL=1
MTHVTNVLLIFIYYFFFNVGKTCDGLLKVAHVVRNYQVPRQLQKRLKSLLGEDLAVLMDRIQRIIDFDNSAASNRFVVNPFVDARLDESKCKTNNNKKKKKAEKGENQNEEEEGEEKKKKKKKITEETRARRCK